MKVVKTEQKKAKCGLLGGFVRFLVLNARNPKYVIIKISITPRLRS